MWVRLGPFRTCASCPLYPRQQLNTGH
jgi:hypothetical protein